MYIFKINTIYLYFFRPFVKYRCGECDAANIFVVDPTIVHQPRKRTKIASYRV